jgi:outer membrane protein assembly factor BamB
VDGTVYVANVAGVVWAFDAATGKQRWSVKCGDPRVSVVFKSRPVMAGGLLYVAGGGPPPELYALDPATGKRRWRFRADAPADYGTAYSPMVAGSTLCLVPSSDSSKLYGLDLKTGARRWEVTGPWQKTPNPPVLARNMVLIGGGSGDLFGLDAKTGAQRLRLALPGRLLTAPAVVGDIAYAVTAETPAATEGDLCAIRL